MDNNSHTDAPEPAADAEYRYERFTTQLLFRDLRFQSAEVKVGDRLPMTEMFTIDGDRVSMADLAAGRPVLLVFGSVSCPMTASAIPVLTDLHGEFGERIEFVMVNVREAHPGEHYPQPGTLDRKLDHAKALADLYPVPWAIVSDDIEGHLHRSLDPKPNSAFIIDAEGTIVFRALWASDRRALRQALASVAKGEKPERSESTTLLGPVFMAMGRVQSVMERAGPQALSDLWRSAFPMAVAGRVAPLFSPLSPDQRGIAAVLTLTLVLVIILASIGLWVFF